MDRHLLASAFEATVLLSTLGALLVAVRSAFGVQRGVAGAAAERSLPRRAPSSLRALFFHPLTQLGVVCAVIYVNQVLFGAFILRAHGGNPAFIARYIGAGWFAIGTHDPLVQFAAQHVGDGRWLAPSLLRVQAFLELPFTLFAYLAVARLLGRRIYMLLCRPLLLTLASISFSVSFSLVELSLPNPYTNDDLVLRAAAALSVPVYIACITRAEARSARRLAPDETVDDGPSGLLGLLAFLAGAGAISYIVLALYDAFLLYNLAHLPRYAGGIAAAIVVAIGASFAAPRVDAALAKSTVLGGRPSAAMDVCVSALRAFTLLFFVPSLSLRYWGAHPSAVLCGLLLVVLGLCAGLTTALRRAKPTKPSAREIRCLVRLLLAGTVALVLGAFAGHRALLVGASSVMPELVLARVGLSFLVVAIVAFRAVEIFVCWAEHEPKAQADEA